MVDDVKSAIERLPRFEPDANGGGDWSVAAFMAERVDGSYVRLADVLKLIGEQGQ